MLYSMTSLFRVTLDLYPHANIIHKHCIYLNYANQQRTVGIFAVWYVIILSSLPLFFLDGHMSWPVSSGQVPPPHTPTGGMVMVNTPGYPPQYHLGPPPSYPSSHVIFPHSTPTTPSPHPQQPIFTNCQTPDQVSLSLSLTHTHIHMSKQGLKYGTVALTDLLRNGSSENSIFRVNAPTFWIITLKVFIVRH